MEDILLIDDDVELCQMLTEYLGRYDLHVTAVHRGDTGLEAARSRPWPMILLDVMLPGIDGFEVLTRLRTFSSDSVLLLTARGEDVDRIVGLEMGADDYLAKPFDLGELIARAKALIRRGKGASHPTLTALGLEVNTLEQTVRRHGALVDLSPTEYRILEYLIHRPRKIVSKRELLEHLYDYNWEHHSNVIEAHVSNLRKKLESAVPDPEPVIETMRGRGYRLAPEPEQTLVQD